MSPFACHDQAEVLLLLLLLLLLLWILMLLVLLSLVSLPASHQKTARLTRAVSVVASLLPYLETVYLRPKPSMTHACFVNQVPDLST